MKPDIINGGDYTDERGTIRFVNDFDLHDTCRFYTICHPDTNIVRAWQGHQVEKKYFYVIKGRFLLAWVKIDNWENPSFNLTPEFKILSDKKSELLMIPKGYANGVKALEKNSILGVFSDLNVNDSIKEKIRYPSHYWLSWSKF